MGKHGLNDAQVQRFASTLRDAAANAAPVPMLSLKAAVSERDGYRIQHAAWPDASMGYKMGLTSRAKMAQVGVDRPIYGVLAASARLDAGEEPSRAQFIHPRAEPEVAFVMRRAPAPGCGAEELLRCVEYVTIAIELIDSRYRDFKFALGDVIADNASGSRVVLGDMAVRPGKVDLSNVGMVFEVDGVPRHFASSAAILDHPLRSLLALVRLLDRFSDVNGGARLGEGDVVIAGAATEAVPLDAGTWVRLRTDGLGDVSLRMREQE